MLSQKNNIIPFRRARLAPERADSVPALPILSTGQSSDRGQSTMCIERTDAFASYPNLLNQSSGYKLVWHYICFRANDKGLFWRSYQTIANEVGLSRREIINLINEMQEDGLLLKMAETKYKTNLFYVRKPQEVPVDNSVDNSFASEPQFTTLVNSSSPSLVNSSSPKRKIKTLKEKNLSLKNSDFQKTVDVGSVELQKCLGILKRKVA